MAIVTLTQARRSLAERLGGYRLITSGVQTDPPSGSYVGVANGADAARRIVSSDLTVLDVAGTSTPMQSDRWKHAAAYIPSIPIQRQIAEFGFNGARLASDVTDQSSLTTTYVGMLTLAEIMGSALAAGTAVEIHSTMPPLSREQGMGLHACINRALRAMAFRDRLSIATLSDTLRYDLSAYPWIENDRQLIGVWDSESAANTEPSPLRRGGEIRFDAHVPYLIVDAEPTSTMFYADFWRPVGSWVRVAGSWAASTAGLVNETDAVMVDQDHLTVSAYFYACQALARAWRGDPMQGYWLSEVTAYLPVVARLLVLDRQVQQTPSGRGQSRSINRTASSGRGSTSWP